MLELREIPLRDLPIELTLKMHEEIRRYSVTMWVNDADGSNHLFISGTLARVANRAGILTARHVWNRIRRAPTLNIWVGYHDRLDLSILRTFGPRIEGFLPEIPEAEVPDLALVEIPAHDLRRIEAYGNKAFYSIDARRQNPEMDLFSERGFWVLSGSPQVLVNHDTREAPSLLYDTTVERSPLVIGDWDYLSVNLNLQQNPELPRDYGGVSGGGIWRVAFCLSNDQSEFAVENLRRDIVLSGVAFYQTGEERRQIIGHGPKSLYATLHEHLDEIT